MMQYFTATSVKLLEKSLASKSCITLAFFLVCDCSEHFSPWKCAFSFVCAGCNLWEQLLIAVLSLLWAAALPHRGILLVGHHCFGQGGQEEIGSELSSLQLGILSSWAYWDQCHVGNAWPIGAGELLIPVYNHHKSVALDTFHKQPLLHCRFPCCLCILCQLLTFLLSFRPSTSMMESDQCQYWLALSATTLT